MRAAGIEYSTDEVGVAQMASVKQGWSGYVHQVHSSHQAHTSCTISATQVDAGATLLAPNTTCALQLHACAQITAVTKE